MSKSKKYIFFGSVAVFLVILMVLFLSREKKSENNVSQQNSSVENLIKEKNEENEEKSFPLVGNNSIQNLVAQNKSLECAISYSETEEYGAVSTLEGSVFTDEGKMRGDFLITVDGNQNVHSMIIEEKTMFYWSEIEGEKYGVEVQLEAYGSNNGEVSAKEPITLDAPVAYECKEWKNVDRSVFETPNDIIFSGFDDILKRGMEYGNIYDDEGEAQNPCEICALINDQEAKKQCSANFSCSL